MTLDDAEVVVALGALLHDTGISIHRAEHETFSLFVAQSKLRELLAEIYDVPTATLFAAKPCTRSSPIAPAESR